MPLLASMCSYNLPLPRHCHPNSIPLRPVTDQNTIEWWTSMSHWGGPDPVDEEQKDDLVNNMCIYDDCALNVDLHSQALLLNKHLTKSTQLNLAIGYLL